MRLGSESVIEDIIERRRLDRVLSYRGLSFLSAGTAMELLDIDPEALDTVRDDGPVAGGAVDAIARSGPADDDSETRP